MKGCTKHIPQNDASITNHNSNIFKYTILFSLVQFIKYVIVYICMIIFFILKFTIYEIMLIHYLFFISNLLNIAMLEKYVCMFTLISSNSILNKLVFIYNTYNTVLVFIYKYYCRFIYLNNIGTSR